MINKSLISHYCRMLGFEVHGAGYMQAIRKQSFQDNAFEKQREIIGERGRVIFDIGANRGNVTEKYLKMFPNASVFAFEPYPDTYEALKGRFKIEANVSCHKYAISDSTGQQTFYVNKNIDTNSILKPKKSGLSSDVQVQNEKVITVEATTVDLFCKSNQINQIDILKMDIQGGELSALKGSIELLKLKKIRLIYLETFFI